MPIVKATGEISMIQPSPGKTHQRICPNWSDPKQF